MAKLIEITNIHGIIEKQKMMHKKCKGKTKYRHCDYTPAPMNQLI